jgi:pantetheine-phosphate adenylyltransferase
MPVALYPGSFDPIHFGHLDVIEQGVELFGSVVVVTMHNPAKPSGAFSLAERQAMISESLAAWNSPAAAKVRVESFPGLAIDAAVEFGAHVIVKGLRSASDFDVEQQMALTNFAVGGVRTVFVPAAPELSYISSRYIREIALHGRDLSRLVPAPVATRLVALARGRNIA